MTESRIKLEIKEIKDFLVPRTRDRSPNVVFEGQFGLAPEEFGVVVVLEKAFDRVYLVSYYKEHGRIISRTVAYKVGS